MVRSVRARLLFLTLGLSLLLLCLGVGSLWLEMAAFKQFRQLYDEQLVPVRTLKSMSDSIGLDIVDTLHKVDAQRLAAEEAVPLMGAALTNLHHDWDEFSHMDLDASERDQATVVEDSLHQIDALVRKAMAEVDKPAALDRLIKEELYDVIDPATAALARLTDMKLAEAERIAQARRTNSQNGLLLHALLLAVGVIAAGLSVGLITSDVIRPLGDLRRMVSGRPIDFADELLARRDEIGDIARSYEDARQALNESFVFQTALIDTIPNPLFFKDAQGRFRGCNRAYEQAFAINRESLIGKTVLELDYLPMADRERYHAEDLGLIASSQIARHELVLRFADGEDHDTLYWVAGFRLGCGSPGGLVGVIVDISELRLAEHLLEQAQRQLQEITNSVPGIVYQLRQTRDGWRTFTFLSEKTESVHGVARERALDDYNAMFDSIVDEDRVTIEALFNNPDAVRLPVAVDFRVSLPDRGVRWLHTEAIPHDDGEGGIIWNGYTHDITATKAMAAKLAESEVYFRTVFDNAEIGIFGHDAEGNVLSVNRAFAELLGYRQDELVGMNTATLTHPDDLARTREHLLIITRDTGSHELEKRYLRKDGTPVWTVVRTTRLNLPNRAEPFISTASDISSLKAAEEALLAAKQAAQEASQMKGDFLANMSHEIRTPMNAIIGMTHLTLQTELTPKQRNYLDKIDGSAKALLHIINDILDFSKIEAGKLGIEHADFRLEKVLEALSDMFEIKAEEKGLELLFDIDSSVPMHLNGDALRLGQIFINLVGNAIKFTETGEVVIAAQCLETRDEGYRIRFSVRDTGIGLTPEQRGRLFQAFSQADGSTTRKYGGTGLGLAICKRLAELMGGEIGVDSEYGHGSTFHFTVELNRPEANAAEREEALKDLTGLRVLVVDDNPTAREILQHILESFRCEPTVVESGEAALERLAEGEHFDLLLLDWRMPGMDGLEVVKNLGALPGQGNMPSIIMLSAYAREEAVIQAEALGVHHFLHKPLNPSALLDAMLAVFGRSFVARGEAGARPAPLDTARLAGRLVLLVEDNEINQEVASEFLTQAGLILRIAGDGAEALKQVQEQHFDAVLMDVQMPVMDGYEATRRIRALPGFADLPIIAMTANAMSGDRERCLAVGMNDHIAKPIDVHELYTTLARWLPAGEGGARPGATATPATPNPQPFLPQLPGLDAELGLRRVGGNASLYNKLLRKYLDNQAGTEAELRAALAQEQWPLAERLAHTLKGVSASLGAEPLATQAAELETAAREHRQPTPAQLDRLGASLRTLLDALRQHFLSQSAAKATVEAVDLAAFQSDFEVLRQLLGEDDSAAVEALEAIQERLPPGPVRAALDPIGRAIEHYDFEEALGLLQKFHHEMAMSPENES